MSGMIIATNTLAMNAHRNLKGVGSKQSKASERLSSGLRINRASDDAAGLAISEKMQSQIRGLQQAQRNTEDGINLIQTMDGGMEGIQEMMIRQRELIVQALNDTNTDEDRAKIQEEIDQITAEIGTLAERTTFNNIPLLNVPQNALAASALNPGQTAPTTPTTPTVPAAPTATQTIDLSTLTTSTVSGTGWNFTGGVLTITGSPGEVFELTGTMDAGNRIEVTSGTSAEIILNNVNINTSSGAALDIRGANVNLWLKGTNYLWSTGNDNAGIETTNGTLTIDGTGSITASSSNQAGIGGGLVTTTNDANGGTIIINGGNVTAIGEYCVGIGGGDNHFAPDLHGGRGADLTINGGRVTATGGYATDQIAIGGGGGGIFGTNGGDGGTITIKGGILTASGSIGGGNGVGIGGQGADISVEGGLLEVVSGWIGGGSNFSGTITGSNGTTTVTDGNLSITTPGANIKGGVVNASGDPTTAVQIFFYNPETGQQSNFDPYTEITYTLGTNDYTGITDGVGRLYMYLPSDSQGIQGTMTIGGKTYVGTLETMNANHLDSLVFRQDGTYPPDTDKPSDSSSSKTYARDELWIQCGANSGQGMYVSRYDCRPEALYEYVFDPNTITIEVNGMPKTITLKKLVTSPWEEATASLIALDSVFGKVNSYRAQAGAQQNRLEFTNDSVAIAFANLEDAHSRIRDADMAKEMMNLTKANVLEQAGMAILAQANQAPQSVLQLLQ